MQFSVTERQGERNGREKLCFRAKEIYSLHLGMRLAELDWNLRLTLGQDDCYSRFSHKTIVNVWIPMDEKIPDLS